MGNEFGRAVMVFEERDDLAAYEPIRASETEEDAEEEGDEVIDGKVDEVLHRSMFPLDRLG